MKKIESKNAYDEFVSPDALRIVKFSAEWCNPCKVMSKIIADIENDEKYSEMFAEVDIENEDTESIAQNFGIRAIPTMIFYKNGLIIDKTVGAMDKNTLIKRIQENIDK